MTTFDLDLLNPNLLPIKDETLTPAVVETNFRELQEAVRLIQSRLAEVSSLFVAPAVPGFSLTTGRYTETFTATNSKLVVHNLNVSNPQVMLYRSDGVQIYPLVTIVDADTVRLDFNGTLTDAVVVVDVGQA